ncbi:MAG: hypothetical protein DMD67_07425 [Gemmatimonadetes bacterium]|nr:MAG: hypothetical protein DMD67_07425 [Gemmatimonadota bacterium]
MGNGWGLSTDGGKTWTNWTGDQLGHEWQYVAPNGIVTRGDTVYVATADGIKLSWDRGASWAEITDSIGTTSAGHVWGRIRSQYVLALARGADGSLWAGHLRGLARSTDGGGSWTEYPTPVRCPGVGCADRVRALAPDTSNVVWVGTEHGLYRLAAGQGGRAGGGMWLDKKGHPACEVALVVTGCRADMPGLSPAPERGAHSPARAKGRTRRMATR